MTFIWKSP